MSIDLTVTALAGSTLAPSAFWSTLPMATIAIGSVVTAPVVSTIIASFGIKRTLLAGTTVAVFGGLLSYLALSYRLFPLLCIGTFAVGVYQAVANYYRYIAADSKPGAESQSIAYVISAGVIAAFIGPVIATVSSTLVHPLYSGSYIAVSVLGLCAFITLTLLPISRQRNASTSKPRETLTEPNGVSITRLFTRPKFNTGAALSFAGCFSMAVVMSSAPFELRYNLNATPTTNMIAMQLHMIGMYGPMLLLPWMAKRLTQSWQVFIGIVFGLAGLGLGAIGGVSAVEIALFTIGVSWAVTYSTGSALLTTSYSASERKVARGVGELFPVSGLAIGSFVAGPLVNYVGWLNTIVICISILFLAAVVCYFYRRSFK